MSSLLLTGAGPSGASGGGGFTPASVPGLAAWWDASAITGLNNNDAVASWTDSSGNSQTITQGTGAAQPIYKTAIQNGRPVVRFDGVDDALSVANALGVTDDMSMFVVCSKAITASHGMVVKVGGANGVGIGAGTGTIDTNGDTLIALSEAIGWRVSSQSFTPATFAVVSSGFSRNPTPAGTMHFNGTSGLSDSVSFLAPNTISYVGRGQTASRFWPGDVAEVIVYNTVVSGANRDLLETYLGTKWGITVV